MQNQITDTFNYQIVTYARLFFDHEELGSDLMGDPADYEEKTFSELGVADIDALHEYVRADKTLNAYEVFQVYQTTINGHGLVSAKIPVGGKAYFCPFKMADDMKIIPPSEFVKPLEEQASIPYVEKHPELKGRALVLPGMSYQLLEENDRVYDRATGACVWKTDPTKPALEPAAPSA
ncbi:MAG: hypothetical protein DI551_05575 [Micavibrio aeruginosavorus]|uniref:Uncharacterized protein n=1 Tax=Micavibrio aeruginosavorus TaxID=349221 RepID=A0A2W5N1C1_9BACT|nr:MAG: hypothetical protein DI551_05575 [Micavibrio aeruginosavorus]